MLIPLKLLQFHNHQRVGGVLLNQVVDPSNPRDKGTEMYATELGVIVQSPKFGEAFMPWGAVVNAIPEKGYSFVDMFDETKPRSKVA